MARKFGESEEDMGRKLEKSGEKVRRTWRESGDKCGEEVGRKWTEHGRKWGQSGDKVG